LRAGPPSLKTADAALCLKRLVSARPAGKARPGPFGAGSSFQRRARLVATCKPVPGPSASQWEALARLAAQLGIDPERDPSGLGGIAHRLHHDGLLSVSR
jgi:hypothetical protein